MSSPRCSAHFAVLLPASHGRDVSHRQNMGKHRTQDTDTETQTQRTQMRAQGHGDTRSTGHREQRTWIQRHGHRGHGHRAHRDTGQDTGNTGYRTEGIQNMGHRERTQGTQGVGNTGQIRNTDHRKGPAGGAKLAQFSRSRRSLGERQALRFMLC